MKGGEEESGLQGVRGERRGKRKGGKQGVKGMEGVRGDGEGHPSPSALISCVSVTSTVSRSVMYPNMAMATYTGNNHSVDPQYNKIAILQKIKNNIIITHLRQYINPDCHSST